jgi:hypothetical protein
MMAADISEVPALHAGVPQPLFKTGRTERTAGHQYGTADNGKRFVFLVPEPSSRVPSIIVNVHWRPKPQQ